MAQKKKLDLKELELQLPPIDSNETKIILGGNDYDDNFINHFLDGGNDSQLPGDFRISEGPHSGDHHHTEQPDDDDDDDGRDYDDYGDLDHYFDDYQDAGGDDDSHEPPSGGTGSGFNIDLALTSINNQVHDVYNGLTQAQLTQISLDSDFAANPVFGHQLINALASNSVLASLLSPFTNGQSHLSFDIRTDMPGDKAFTTADDPNHPNGVVISINQIVLDSLGWNLDSQSTNNGDGVNLSLLNSQQDFIAMLAHEFIHAQQSALFAKALANSNGTVSGTYDYMLNTMHVNPAIVGIYFTTDSNGNIIQNPNAEQAAHDYMQSNPGVSQAIMSAVTEFNSDLSNMQQAINHLTQTMDYAQQQANSANPQGGYNNAQWQQILNSLQSKLNGIKDSWGSWLNYNGH